MKAAVLGKPVAHSLSPVLHRAAYEALGFADWTYEVVECDERGLAIFQKLCQRREEHSAFLYAFDLLELNGADLRREPIEVRKATLASRHGMRLNEHMTYAAKLTLFDGHLRQNGPP